MRMNHTQETKNFGTPAVKAHQQQRFWQILLPVILVSLLILGALLWLILTGGTATLNASNLSGVAVVFLALPFLLIALITLALFSAVIFGLTKLKPLVPQAGMTVLQAFEKTRCYLRKGADISIQPLLIVNENAEKFRQAVRSLNSRLVDKGK